MNIIFKYVEEKCEPMEYDQVKYIMDELCRDIGALGKSGRLRIYNKIMNELGGKTEAIDNNGSSYVEYRYQALLNARNMLGELGQLMKLSVRENHILYEKRDNVLDQQRKQTTDGSGKKRKAKFPLRMSEVLAILGGSFLGALLTRILLG